MSLGLWAGIGEAIVRGMMVMGGYITNSSTFPQPLSEEEEARYLARLQQGDDDARSVLIERNLRLVAHIVNTSWPKLQVKPGRPPASPRWVRWRGIDTPPPACDNLLDRLRE